MYQDRKILQKLEGNFHGEPLLKKEIHRLMVGMGAYDQQKFGSTKMVIYVDMGLLGITSHSRRMIPMLSRIPNIYLSLSIIGFVVIATIESMTRSTYIIGPLITIVFSAVLSHKGF